MRFHAKKICLCILGVSMLAGAARAQDIVGRLHLQIILEPGCAVSNGAQSEIGNAHLDFGAADNASHPVDSVVVGDEGRAAFSITCSSHYTGRNAPTVSIDSGLHMRGMQRRMAGPGSSYAVYGLFRHRARKEAYDPDVPVQLQILTAGIAVPVDIFGRVPRPDGLPDASIPTPSPSS